MDPYSGTKAKTQMKHLITPTKVKPATETTKLDTFFVFKSFGNNFHQFREDIQNVSSQKYYSFKSVGYKLSGEYHLVSEIQVQRGTDSKEDKLKLAIENALCRNGVTSFGAGPHPDNKMLVFQLRNTQLTFDWSDYVIPTPAAAGCFITVGKDTELFPGPQFPMSHLLYGVDSEMNMSSLYSINNEASLLVKAHFNPPPFFQQDNHRRIVAPGMEVSDFLALTFQATDMTDYEPFLILKVSVVLQEFVSVYHNSRVFQDTREMTLLENAPHEMIWVSRRPLKLPTSTYACKLPSLGPTFYSEDLTRSYGLKVSMKLTRKSMPLIKTSTFMELHVAQEHSEKFKGSSFTLSSKHRKPSLYVETMVPTGKGDIKSFFDNELKNGGRKFQRYRFQSHGNINLLILETFLSKIDDPPGLLENIKSSKKYLLKFLKDPPNNHKISSRILNRPVAGSDMTNLDGPYASTCVKYGKNHLQAISFEKNYHYMRTYSSYSVPAGDESFPLTMLFKHNEHGRFRQTRNWGLEAIVVPGMKLSEFVSLLFVLPLSYHDMKRVRPTNDIRIQIHRLEITLIQTKVTAGIQTKKETPLFSKNELAVLYWSQFNEGVTGSRYARAMRVPPAVIKGGIPSNAEPSQYGFSKSVQYSVKVCLLWSHGREVKRLMWSYFVEIAEPGSE